MSKSRHLPHWPPRQSSFEDILPMMHNNSLGDAQALSKATTGPHGRGVPGPPSVQKGSFEVGAEIACGGRGQSGRAFQNDDSVEIAPIFGGKCTSRASCSYDALDLLDFSWDSSATAASLGGTAAAAAASIAVGEQQGDRLTSDDSRACISSDKAQADVTVPESSNHSVAATRVSKTRYAAPFRVRFSPATVVVSPCGEAAKSAKAPWTTEDRKKNVTTLSDAAFAETASENSAPVTVGSYGALTDGQRFVPRINGMHTAWRLHKPNNPPTGPPVSSKGDYPVPANDQAVIGTDKVFQKNIVEQHQQHSGRLFLRRQARPILSQRSVNEALVTTSPRPPSKTITTTKRGEPAARRVKFCEEDITDNGCSRDPLTISVESEGGQRYEIDRVRGGVSARVGSSPADHHCPREIIIPPASWATNGPRRRSAYGAPNLATAARSLARSSGAVGGVTTSANGRAGDADGNRLATAPGRLLSSPSVRKNLARAARASKVGTKADPVTLYRQRQELEQARRISTAARNKGTRPGVERRGDSGSQSIGGRRDLSRGGQRAGGSRGLSWR